MSGLAAAPGEKRRRPTNIELRVRRAFKKVGEKPVVSFTIEGLGMGWGRIDFRYRDLSVRMDAEKGYAIGFVALTDGFSPCWYLHDVLELVTGINQGYLSAQALCERLIGHYDAVVAAVTSDTGRDALARMQNPRFNEWATESATWRDPAEQARIAAQIERARGFDRQLWRSWGPKLRDGALILLLLAGIVGVLIYSTFVRQP